ncbi:MAG TPA: Rpn family recombination-promoting nuclease/putative transposase [Polyangium sp.]|nr:Rpn family recombination-promoting nuclease/putative transposase [Polyangium sp.]
MTNQHNGRDNSADEPQPSAESEDAAIPHDAVFFKILSKPEHAAAELKCIFPSALVAAIDWSTLRPRPLRFVDAKLSSKYADVLFSVDIASKEILIYILFEHKSVADRWTLLQLLEYQSRIWREYLEDPENKGKTHLPVILPVVLHHSENGWTCPKRFHEYFDVPAEILQLVSPYMIDFGILLDDISKVDGTTLVARPLTPEGRLLLFALRFGRTPDQFMEQLPHVIPALLTLRSKPHGGLVIASIIVYLKTVGKMLEEDVRMALQQAVGNSIADEILFGAERRIEKAWNDGQLDGQRNLLKRQLGQRFGMLSPDAIARIEAAPLDDLEAIGLRAFTAATLDEVLGTPPTEPS